VMPDENAFDLLPRIKKMRPNLPVIVMSAQNTFMTAIRASERGAYEYLPKPFDLKELIAIVGRALAEPKERTTNAAEAVVDLGSDAEIQLTTAFRPGVRLSVPGKKSRVSLPLEFCVKDNGPGVPEDLLPNLFDPFVTTKPTGSGLGLALVAKIVGDHGGIIECESQPRKTTFRVLLPMYNSAKHHDQPTRDDVSGTPLHASHGTK